jgi:hypothetical protein
MRQDIFVFCWCRSNLHDVFDKLTYDESTVETAQVSLLVFQKVIFFKNGGGDSIFFELKIISILLFFGPEQIHILYLIRFNYVESNAKYRLTWH